MNNTTCDICGREFDANERRVLVQRRPSDKTEIVATMWACDECGIKNNWPTHTEVWKKFDRGEYPGVCFVSV